MKKNLFLLLSAFVLVGGIAYAYPDDPTYQSWTNKSDKVVRQGTAVRELKMVRFVSQAQNGPNVASGDALVYSVVSDDGVSVALTTTSVDGAFAGIAATAILTSDVTGSASAQDDAGRRNWGWIVVHGPAVAKISANHAGTNAHSAGDAFLTSSDSGAINGLNTVSQGDTNLIARRLSGVGGFFFNAGDASSTTTDVMVENVQVE